MDKIIANITSDLANKPVFEEDHPRFADFKNEGKVAEKQRLRRQEHLDRQTSARDERLNRYRELCNADSVTTIAKENAFSSGQKSEQKNPFADQLMLSDWLVDIPTELSTEWTMLPSPRGKRCLVVAQNGETNVFTKLGRKLIKNAFESNLPGGGKENRSNSKTILDCIFERESKANKFFVLDAICWDNHFLGDSDFTSRRFYLKSWMDDLAPKLLSSSISPYSFYSLPSCACSVEEMTEFMKQEFAFRLDGLLFYYSAAHYIPEQTPLVGWLKPWMLPEILNVPIPESYIRSPSENQNLRTTEEYIANFNAKKHHVSTAEKEKLKRDKDAAEKRKKEMDAIETQKNEEEEEAAKMLAE